MPPPPFQPDFNPILSIIYLDVVAKISNILMAASD
jgi:hypothetical protein